MGHRTHGPHAALVLGGVSAKTRKRLSGLPQERTPHQPVKSGPGWRRGVRNHPRLIWEAALARLYLYRRRTQICVRGLQRTFLAIGRLSDPRPEVMPSPAHPATVTNVQRTGQPGIAPILGVKKPHKNRLRRHIIKETKKL